LPSYLASAFSPSAGCSRKYSPGINQWERGRRRGYSFRHTFRDDDRASDPRASSEKNLATRVIKNIRISGSIHALLDSLLLHTRKPRGRAKNSSASEESRWDPAELVKSGFLRMLREILIKRRGDVTVVAFENAIARFFRSDRHARDTPPFAAAGTAIARARFTDTTGYSLVSRDSSLESPIDESPAISSLDFSDSGGGFLPFDGRPASLSWRPLHLCPLPSYTEPFFPRSERTCRCETRDSQSFAKKQREREREGERERTILRAC